MSRLLKTLVKSFNKSNEIGIELSNKGSVKSSGDNGAFEYDRQCK